MAGRNGAGRGTKPGNHQKYVPTSHDGISHDSLANLGQDWSLVADPGMKPRPPFKVYLPRTTEDVVTAVRECRDAGVQLVVRGHAHSSNDLVTPDHGTVLLTDLLNGVLDVDPLDLTVTVQPGARLAMVDEVLSEHGFGLKVIGDHDHITAAGFASVGGISPASHRHGIFLDTVLALEYVDWTGEVHRCGREQDLDQMLKVLGGTGRHGVITELTLTVEVVDKFRTILRNERHITTSLDEFVRYSSRMIRNPGDAVMERGVWADFEVPGLRDVSDLSLRVGQFSSYHPTSQNPVKTLWNRVAYGYQQAIGAVAGRLPAAMDNLLKYVGMGCIILSPRYGNHKNVERFTDQILDSTVGDPTRMFVVLGPVERYENLFYALNDLVVKERRRSGAITFISVYVKSIRSRYLSGPQAWGLAGEEREPGRFCELMLYVGVRPEKMTRAVTARLVAEVDEICLAHGAFRYLHTLTSTDPTKLAQLDPNALYGGRELPVGRRNGQAKVAKPGGQRITAVNTRTPRGRKQVEEAVG
ncbi:FAD-binding oxidoreductase [Lentzea aerocolonigenes]|uniref:FAD-binding oxidoreductase n=1 Tax=Lentzea aerocolonigenes TaxID=68170 RepID=UPI0004C34D96|nr:FAD-binding oxidoreductase [Lentzea aerocolonigenes]MCP2242315.1 FAD binding domain-containing protein [Lentzea aerocolonigenes]